MQTTNMPASLVVVFIIGVCFLLTNARGLFAQEFVGYSAAGSDAAAIQGVVDAFRNAAGTPNNGNTPGPLPSGRREINWDGGGDAAPATTFPVPMTTFSTAAQCLLLLELILKSVANLAPNLAKSLQSTR